MPKIPASDTQLPSIVVMNGLYEAVMETKALRRHSHPATWTRKSTALLDRLNEAASIVDRLMAMPLPKQDVPLATAPTGTPSWRGAWRAQAALRALRSLPRRRTDPPSGHI